MVQNILGEKKTSVVPKGKYWVTKLCCCKIYVERKILVMGDKNIVLIPLDERTKKIIGEEIILL